MELTETPSGADAASVFAATLRPYRSLDPRGFALLMAVLAGMSFISGMAFALNGAWPIMGFFGLDVGLVYLAFRINYRAADACERVVLSESQLIVERHRRGQLIGRWSFQPYWLRVQVTEGRSPAVVLASHGRSVAVGSFLSPDERQGFAQALSDSLEALKLAPHMRAPS
jgi:uncharacterized membrane protein